MALKRNTNSSPPYLAAISDDGLYYWRQQVLTYAHGPADFYRRADVLVNFIQSPGAGEYL